MDWKKKIWKKYKKENFAITIAGPLLRSTKSRCLPARFGCLAVCVCVYSPFPSLQATILFPFSVHRAVTLLRGDHRSSQHNRYSQSTYTLIHAYIRDHTKQMRFLALRISYRISYYTGCPENESSFHRALAFLHEFSLAVVVWNFLR